MNMLVPEFVLREKLVALLEAWASWRHSDGISYGYSSPRYFPSGVYHAWDLFDSTDTLPYRITERAVEDMRKKLPGSHEALMKRYCDVSFFNFPRNNYPELLERAHEWLEAELPKRNVVIL